MDNSEASPTLPWRILMALALITLVLISIHPLPQLIAAETVPTLDELSADKRLEHVTKIRESLLQGTGAILLVVAAISTLRQLDLSRQQNDLARSARLADAFTGAVTQIADSRPVSQLAGVYSLDRLITLDPPLKPVAVDLLSEYIRRRPRPAGTEPALSAALRVYCQHRSGSQRNLTKSALSGLNLSGINFSGVDLRYSDLRDVDLTGADLRSADLRESDLSRAILSGARLDGALLEGARLPETAKSHQAPPKG